MAAQRISFNNKPIAMKVLAIVIFYCVLTIEQLSERHKPIPHF